MLGLFASNGFTPARHNPIIAAVYSSSHHAARANYCLHRRAATANHPLLRAFGDLQPRRTNHGIRRCRRWRRGGCPHRRGVVLRAQWPGSSGGGVPFGVCVRQVQRAAVGRLRAAGHDLLTPACTAVIFHGRPGSSAPCGSSAGRPLGWCRCTALRHLCQRPSRAAGPGPRRRRRSFRTPAGGWPVAGRHRQRRPGSGRVHLSRGRPPAGADFWRGHLRWLQAQSGWHSPVWAAGSLRPDGVRCSLSM